MRSARDYLDAPDPSDERAARERAETDRQLAQLYAQWPDHVATPDGGTAAAAHRQALVLAEQAGAGFATLGDREVADQVQLLAAEIEIEILGDPGAAIARLVALRAAATARGATDLAQHCGRLLDGLAHPAGG